MTDKKNKNSEKDSLMKNTILLSIGALLTKGLAFVLVPFFSRWLTTEDYGTFDLIGTYVSLLIPLITLACGEAIFRFSIDSNDEEGKKAYVTNGLLILVANLLLVFVLVEIGNLFWHIGLITSFFLLLIGELLNNHLQAFLRATKRLDIYSFCSAITTIGFGIFVFIFVRIFNMGLAGMICGYAVGYLFGDIILIIWTKYWRFLDLDKISLETIKQMVSYSYVLIPNSLSWWVLNVSDRLIIKFALGAAANGIYAISYKIPNLCSAIFGMFSISWQQQASLLKEEKERQNYFQRIFNQTLSTLLSLCAGILSCNFLFFNYIFDSKYYEARLYAPILAVAIVFMSLSQFFGGIQISLKQPKENGITTVIGAVVNLVVNIVLIKFVGLYAAALSTLISNIVVTETRRIRLKNRYIFKIKKYNWIYIIFFTYFFIMSYFIRDLRINVINLLLASCFCVFVNREIVIKFINKFVAK